MPLDDVIPDGEPPKNALRRAVSPVGNVLKPGVPRLGPAGRTGILEPRGPNNPSPEELATPVTIVVPDDPLPLSVRIVFEEFLLTIQSLDGAERAAAVEYAVRELNNRRAG